MTKRCSWVKMTNPLYIAYHDEEWGQPLHDDQALFELLCMETYQAGLSWETVLKQTPSFPRSISWLSNSRSRRDDQHRTGRFVGESSHHSK